MFTNNIYKIIKKDYSFFYIIIIIINAYASCKNIVFVNCHEFHQSQPSLNSDICVASYSVCEKINYKRENYEDSFIRLRQLDSIYVRCRYGSLKA